MVHAELDETLLRNQLVRLMPQLRRFARSLTRDPDRADDLVQSACERALSRLDHFQEGSRFDSWMYRIIYTRWIDKLRRRNTRRTYLNLFKSESDATLPRLNEESTRTSMIDVRSALEKLPADQRAAILLVCVEGVSYADAAIVLDLPPGTIASRVARARTALSHLFYGAERGESRVVPFDIREKRK